MQMKLRRSAIATSVLILFCSFSLVDCGRNPARVVAANLPPGPVPRIETISPKSSKQAGPAFTLSIVGSQFLPNSTVQWNGAPLPTTVVNGNLINAKVPANTVSEAGPATIWIQGPGRAAARSNVVTLAIPCVVAAPTPASAQTRARLGAYYFDGWAGSLTTQSFNGLPLGDYKDHEPFSGWQDNSTCAVEQQLAAAHNFGINFFVFDWYFNAQRQGDGENLNSALQITHSLPDRHGMQFAILYVDEQPFIAGPQDWNSAVAEWLGYMSDPAYVRVNGRPLLVIYDMAKLRQTFGSSDNVANAFSQLRAAAVAQGLPGVCIAGAFYGSYDAANGTGSFPDLSTTVAEGYDAITMYNYAAAGDNAQRPFSTLSKTGQWMWEQANQKSPLPFLPTAMDGWDARPWGEGGGWYERTPQDVADFVDSAIVWAGAHPRLRPEPATAPPLVLIEAWNELGEGSYIVPTAGDGTSYGDALANMLQTAP